MTRTERTCSSRHAFRVTSVPIPPTPLTPASFFGTQWLNLVAVMEQLKCQKLACRRTKPKHSILSGDDASAYISQTGTRGHYRKAAATMNHPRMAGLGFLSFLYGTFGLLRMLVRLRAYCRSFEDETYAQIGSG